MGLLLASALVDAAAGQEWRRERPIGPGVRYTRLYRSDGPCAIQVVEADTSNPYIHIGTSLPGRPTVGVLRLSAQARRLASDDRYPIAAINGDYFIPDRGRFMGIPIGACITQREVVHSPYPRSAVIVDRAGGARIVILRMRGEVIRPDGQTFPLRAVNHPRDRDALVLYSSRFAGTTRTGTGGTELVLAPEALPLRCGEYLSAIVREVRHGAGDTPIPADGLVLSAAGPAAAFVAGIGEGDQIEFRLDFDPPLGDEDEVIGGGPRLLRAGRVSVEDEANVIARTGGHARHPRTAVGIRDRSVFFVTVDGRRPGYSVGMTLWELARLMQSLGCSDAMALDGGGSTTMWVRGSVDNRPSGGRERPVANGLLVFSTAPRGPAARLAVVPSSLSLLPGAAAGIQVSAEDQYYNPVPIRPGDLQWSFDPPLFRVDSGGRLRATPPIELAPDRLFQETRGIARAGEGSAELRFRVYARPHHLQVSPAKADLKPGQVLTLAAIPVDEAGRPLPAPRGAVQWNCPRNLGTCDAQGAVRAGPGPGAGWVLATLNGTTAQVPVTVGTIVRPLAEFTQGTNWRQLAVPASAKVAADILRDAPDGIDRALRLRYSFANRGGIRAAYAQATMDLGDAVGMRLRVWGDGSGSALRAKVRDSAARQWVILLCPRITWKETWREVAAPIPAAARPPLKLESLSVCNPVSRLPARGSVLLADLRGEYRPPFPTPVSATAGARPAPD